MVLYDDSIRVHNGRSCCLYPRASSKAGTRRWFMKKGRRKRNIIPLCIGAVCAILIIWTIWGNTALMVSEISIFQ